MAAITSPARPAPTAVRTPLFIVGVVLALVAFLVMLGFGLLFANRATPGGSVRMVVATHDIDARAPINPLTDLGMSTIPLSAQPQHGFFAVSELANYSAVVPIYKGEVITENVVESSPGQVLTGQDSYLPIPQGFVALTLPTSEQTGVAGYIAQGDYIDVIATVNTSAFSPVSPHQVTRTVFTNLHVIRVGPQTTEPKQGQAQGVASSLTVVMSLCDAQYMDWLTLNSVLKYALLSYHDYSTTAPQADSACPPTGNPDLVGPVQVNSRWNFTKS